MRFFEIPSRVLVAAILVAQPAIHIHRRCYDWRIDSRWGMVRRSFHLKGPRIRRTVHTEAADNSRTGLPDPDRAGGNPHARYPVSNPGIESRTRRLPVIRCCYWFVGSRIRCQRYLWIMDTWKQPSY